MPKSSGRSTRKSTPPAIPSSFKFEVELKAKGLVDNVLKPLHVLPPPENPQFNYIEDIYTKWHGNKFYFCSSYRVPNPIGDVDHFEARFARMKYSGRNRFDLSFMRHTGEWIKVYVDMTLDQCLAIIREDALFQP